MASTYSPSRVQKWSRLIAGTALSSPPREFANVPVGIPDGIRCDERGNVWAACGDGVNVFAVGSGKLILR